MRKKILIIILIILLLLFSAFSLLYINEKKNEKQKLKQIETEINNIKTHFSENVITNSEAILYQKQDTDYIEYGKINSNVKISLENQDVDQNTKYFHIKDFDLYIEYKYVMPTEADIKEERYSNYIPFNENIKTKANTSFYNDKGEFLYALNQSYDFPILIKDDDAYGVAFNDELLYVKADDVENVYDNTNTDLTNKTRIRTLTYHAIYNPENTECGTSICQTLEMFESHLKYIRENNYFTLKLNELELYLDGKLQIPEKSIVLTIDDGTLLDEEALKLLEEYKVNATLFVITGWVDPNNFKSNYLDLESHTHNMHNQYECPGYGSQGGGILCLPEEEVLEDLRTSQEKLGGSKYIAYPFFDFNDRAIKLLKEAGFKLAFIGQYDTEGYSYPLITDRYKVRRMTIFSDTSMDEFISYLH